MFNTEKNIRATLFFSASASCSKLLNVKSEAVLPPPLALKFELRLPKWAIEEAQSCSKILNGKKYIQYSEKFQGKLCFQGK